MKTIVKFLQDQKYYKKSNELQHSFVINTHTPYSYLVTIVNKYNSFIHCFFLLYSLIHVKPHRWYNGKRARLECGRSWVRAPCCVSSFGIFIHGWMFTDEYIAAIRNLGLARFRLALYMLSCKNPRR